MHRDSSAGLSAPTGAVGDPGGRAAVAPPWSGEALRGRIEQLIAVGFDLDPLLLRQPTRGRQRVALARQAAMYLAHTSFGLSMTEVGRLFERDRTTVAHACAVIELRREQADFNGAMDLLEGVLALVDEPPSRPRCSRSATCRTWA